MYFALHSRKTTLKCRLLAGFPRRPRIPLSDGAHIINTEFHVIPLRAEYHFQIHRDFKTYDSLQQKLLLQF